MNRRIIFLTPAFACLALCAATGKGALSAHAAPVAAFEIENVFNWIDVTNSFFDANGAHGIRKANPSDLYSNGIGLKQQLNMEKGKSATITFQIPDYDHNSRALIDGHRDCTKPYDIILYNVDTNFNARFRLWVENSSIVGQESSWIEFCESKTSEWETYSGGYVSGVCTNNSSFTFSFNTTDFFSMKCDWKEPDQQMVKFEDLGDIGSKKQQYLEFMQTNFGFASEIEFWFAHEQLAVNTVNEVVLKEVNGQSLSVIDGQFDDIVAPIVAPIHFSDPAKTFSIGTEYTMRLEKYMNDPSTKADFFVRPSSDVTCSIDTLVETSKLMGKAPGSDEWKQLGEVDPSSSMIKKISFDKGGEWQLKLTVADGADNIGESPVITVNVVKGYSITLNGEVPSSGKTNQEIVLPTATAEDENGVSRPVTITIEDSLGTITKLESNRFTPQTVGIYYVTYNSSYEEGGVTKKASPIEREIIISKGEEPTPASKDFGGIIIAASIVGGVLLIGGVTFIVIKKRKGK